ncbi:hypothetical protein A2U01_0041886, partial [Trifolium medium]|nr:hypothetical protein [Trifolium medium]
MTPHFCVFEIARTLHMSFWEKLEFQGLRKFVECRAKFNVARVKAVVCELDYDSNELGMESVLENNKIVSFSPEAWKKLFNLDWEGITYFGGDKHFEGMNKTTFLREITKSSVPLGNPSNIP